VKETAENNGTFKEAKLDTIPFCLKTLERKYQINVGGLGRGTESIFSDSLVRAVLEISFKNLRSGQGRKISLC